MRTAELHRKDYEAVKASIISDIWFSIKDRENNTLEITERIGIPAIVTNVIDDQESETIDSLIAESDKVIAIASTYDNIVSYDLEEFEVPFLLDILESVEKHLELEE